MPPYVGMTREKDGGYIQIPGKTGTYVTYVCNIIIIILFLFYVKAMYIYVAYRIYMFFSGHLALQTALIFRLVVNTSKDT